MRLMHVRFSWLPLLLMTADAAGGAAPDINSTAARPDLAEEAWPEGDLPEQMGGSSVTLLPGIDVFKLPDNLAQLWSEREMEDGRTKQKVKRQVLKMDRNSPLVAVGGQYDGLPFRATFSTNPRPRGKKDDPNTPWVSDAAYLLEIGLGDRSRPKTAELLKQAINRYAGRTVRLEHGLTGQCRGDKVRRILVEIANPQFNAQMPAGPANPATVQQTIEDPSGAKGCGARYYTGDFRNPDAKPGETQYDLEIQCDCGAAENKVVVIRGYDSVDRILPPLGAAPMPGAPLAGAPAAGNTGAGRV